MLDHQPPTAAETGENARVNEVDASDQFAATEGPMYVNPESFLGQGGYAAAVSQAARRMAGAEESRGGVWHDVADEVGTVSPPPSPRFLRVLIWIGDRVIAVGAWLKGRSGAEGYRPV